MPRRSKLMAHPKRIVCHVGGDGRGCLGIAQQASHVSTMDDDREDSAEPARVRDRGDSVANAV